VSVVTTVGGVGASAAAPASSGVFFVDVAGFVPVGAIESPAHQASDEEENAFNDGENPASFEHGARLIEAGTPAVTTRVVVITNLNANWYIQTRTVGIRDASVEVDTSNPSTNERNIDDSDQRAGHATISVELEEGNHRPGAGKDRDDEQREESVWYSLIVLDIWMDEPRQHTNDRDGDDDFKDPKAGEEGRCENHLGVF